MGKPTVRLLRVFGFRLMLVVVWIIARPADAQQASSEQVDREQVDRAASTQVVATTEQLVASLAAAEEGALIEVAAGTYRLQQPLSIGSGVIIRGAGIDRTIITHDDAWEPATDLLPDSEVRLKGFDRDAYLIRLQDRAHDVSLSQLTLRGPAMHGAIFGFRNENVDLNHLRIENTRWSGIRTFGMAKSRIHHCEFVNAGGRWKRGGQPGIDGGITGGAIFATWMSDSDIGHNRFVRTRDGKHYNFYGIKGRQGRRNRIHHNTIEVNFSIEFPFEGDQDMEIDHNVCHGTISIPKHAGGPVPESGRTFWIHHNWMKRSYSIEFVRNGVEISHNLFDFDLQQDGGNLISAFGKAPAAGPASFHNNLIKNPGRGVMWIKEPYSQLEIRNNHIIAGKTATPREEGLFGFHRECDFSTIQIHSNIVECLDQARPLLRSKESYDATVENNRLINVTDRERFTRGSRAGKPGLEEPLRFQCGVDGEFVVDGWQAHRVQPLTPANE